MHIKYSTGSPREDDFIFLMDPTLRNDGTFDPHLNTNWRLQPNATHSEYFIGEGYIIGAYGGTMITYQRSHSNGQYYWMRIGNSLSQNAPSLPADIFQNAAYFAPVTHGSP